MAQVFAEIADAGAMKAILSVAVYLALMLALGIVMALTARRADDELGRADDF
jgi:hypothetical protein